MADKLERLSILPHPRGSLKSEGRIPGSVMSAEVNWTDWIGSQLTESIKDAFTSPGKAARGGDTSISDALNFALTVIGGSMPAAPTGAGTVGTVRSLYHGGRPWTKWDPATVGTGERGILAQGPGLYAGDTPMLAKVYLKYGGDKATVKKLLVEDANIIDTAKKMSPEHLEMITNAEKALDVMGFNASKNGIRAELLYKSGFYDKEAVRKVLVDNGIDGFKQDLGNAFGSEYVIFNPAAIKSDRPYANVPDSLLGFRKNGPNKASEETKFRHEIDVKVTFPDDGMTFVDGMKGLNQEHALERARRNWPGAEIEILTPQEAKLQDIMNQLVDPR